MLRAGGLLIRTSKMKNVPRGTQTDSRVTESRDESRTPPADQSESVYLRSSYYIGLDPCTSQDNKQMYGSDGRHDMRLSKQQQEDKVTFPV